MEKCDHNRTRQEDFQLWSLRIKSAPRSRELASSLVHEEGERNVNENVITTITSGPDDSQLRVAQECFTEVDIWQEI